MGHLYASENGMSFANHSSMPTAHAGTCRLATRRLPAIAKAANAKAARKPVTKVWHLDPVH